MSSRTRKRYQRLCLAENNNKVTTNPTIIVTPPALNDNRRVVVDDDEASSEYSTLSSILGFQVSPVNRSFSDNPNTLFFFLLKSKNIVRDINLEYEKFREHKAVK